MSDIKERLDALKREIQKPEFLEGKGLSNEVNIHIFAYDASEEMTVRHFVQMLKTDQSLNCRLIEQNLYQIFLKICDDLDITEAIPEMEETDGGQNLLNELHTTISKTEFIEKMQYNPHVEGDVLMLTGVGDVFPFMRVHVLLEAMQPYFSDIPILIFYPGTFDGYHLKLFSRLQPNDYYRAFKLK